MKRWFTPQLIGLHLLTIVLIAAFVLLGVWQLGVYQNHQEESRRAKQGVAAVPITEVWGPTQLFTTEQVNRKVTVTGRFLPADQQVWIDSKEGGVWLAAPVEVDGRALMVVRGKAAKAAKPPPVPTGDVSFTAVLQASEDPVGNGFDPSTRTIGSLQVPALINVLPYHLWSGYAISTSPALSDGLALASVPKQDVSWTAGGRNLGYGLQWWVFVAFAIFMWWRMCHDAFDKAEETAAAAKASAEGVSASG